MKSILKLALCAGLVAAAALVGPAAPAHASLGLYRVHNISANDSLSSKSITVSCNPGDKLTTVGGAVTGNGDVLLTKAYADTATGATATAFGIEAISTTANWTVEVYGVCAPAGTLSGLTIVQATLGPDPNYKTPVATCPTGKYTVGGGYFLDSANGQVAIDELRFTSALNQVSATAYNYGTPGNYSFSVQAMCAYSPGSMAYTSFPSANNSVTPKTEDTSMCGGTTPELSGAGGAITYALGGVSLATVNPKLNVGTAEVTAREIGPFGSSWEVEVMGICIS
ncbi:hypothetical protein [Hamadaea tsunoensis]|uniref:hypothetical protein n=1 Tax=Hamadaea tsunoensis TaxID=53368 RepID=UPI0004074A46|nr:hypothetical protein [Hamadaea tsunoensis]